MAIILRMFRLFISVGLALLLASRAGAQTEEANQNLSVRISASSDSFPVGARIGINLDVTNSGATQVHVFAEPEKGGFEFIVRRVGDGLSAQPKITSHLWAARGGKDSVQGVSGAYPRGVSLSGGPISYKFIDPKTTVRLTAVLNDLFDITVPGTYTIQVKKWRTHPSPNPKFVRPVDPVPVSVESNTITITITDPPPPTISMQVTPYALSFSAGSEIDADLAVTNVSNTTVSLPSNNVDPAPEHNGFRFVGSKSGDADAPAWRLNLVNYDWKPYGSKYGRETLVEPGQTVHYAARLSHVLDLSKPGSYTIKTEKSDPVTHNKVESSPVTITVR